MTEKHSPLLPCPFCGKDNVDLADTGAHWVRCLMADCGCEGPVCDTAEYAVAAWNTRSVNGLPEAIAALEAAKDQLKVHGLSPYTMELITAALTKLKG